MERLQIIKTICDTGVGIKKLDINSYRLNSDGLFIITINGIEYATWKKFIELSFNNHNDNTEICILSNMNDVFSCNLNDVKSFEIKAPSL